MSILDTATMKDELVKAGVKLEINPDWTPEEVYNYIIHQYDIQFLPNPNWKDIEESRQYRPRGTRNYFTGRF